MVGGLPSRNGSALCNQRTRKISSDCILRFKIAHLACILFKFESCFGDNELPEMKL